MGIAEDFSVSKYGDIRYTGSGTNHTVIAFHRFLGSLMAQAQASGDDILDITKATSSERSTDNIITLNPPYNIDDIAAQHLYDGSIVQGVSGAEIYDGIVCYAPAGTYLFLLQNGKIVAPNFWTTGLNADAANGISHRFMVKVRTGGTDIDGRRLIGVTREWGKTFAEFKINGTSRGNNVLALAPATDLNNTTVIGTVKGWTGITNTQGYRLLDVNGDGVTEPYYSEWNRDVYTINQFFERAKWLSRRSDEEAQNTADTGTSYAVGNGTINGQAQSFACGANGVFITRVHAHLKKTGSPTGSLVAKLYASDNASPQAPTGAALATSDSLDVSKLTTSYQEIEIGFATQYKLTASTNYFVALEYTAGDGSNYVQVEGKAAGTYANQNRAQKNGSWVGDAGSDLWFKVYSSPDLYGISGERFRGITHDVVVDNPSGTFSACEPVSWATDQMLANVFLDTGAGGITVNVVASAGTFTRTTGNYLTDGFRPGQTIVTSGFSNGGNNTMKVISTVTATIITVTSTAGLVDESGDGNERVRAGHMWIQLLTGTAPVDNQQITGATSGKTCDVNVTVTERSLSQPFVGSSTGTAIIGSYGLGIETTDLTSSDKLFDLSDTQRVPPNNVTFTVSGLIVAEDRVLVTPLAYRFEYDGEASGPFTDGETLNFGGGGTAKLLKLTDEGATGRMLVRMLTGAVPTNDESITGQSSGATAAVNGAVNPDADMEQFALDVALTGAAETQAKVTPDIPTDTPTAGTIRILCASGIYKRVAYSSWSGDIFTFTAAEDFSSDNAAQNNDVFLAYLDKTAASASENFTVVYSGADRSLFIRDRDGGGSPIKTFETAGTLGSAGGSTTVIRTPDV